MRARLLGAILFLSPAILRAADSAGSSLGKDFKTWFEPLWGQIEITPPLRQIKGAQHANKKSIESKRRESPLTLQTKLTRNDEKLNSPDLSSPTQYGFALSQSLAYQTLFGFDATLSNSMQYTKTKNDLFVPGREVQDRRYSLELELSYDVLRGGNAGVKKNQQSIELLTLEKTKHDLSQQWIDTRVNAFGLLVDLFVSTCKLVELRQSSNVVAKIVSMGKTQLETRLISTKDYLNYLNTQNSIMQRLVSQEGQLSALLQQLRAFGEKFALEMSTIGKEPLLCKTSLDPSEETPDEPINLKIQATNVPRYQSAIANTQASEIRLDLVSQTNRPSLKPFVKGGYNLAPDDTTREKETLSAGLLFQWNFPMDRGFYEKEAAREELSAAMVSKEQALLSSESLLASLQERLRTQAAIFRALETSVKHADQLLKTLEVSVAAGSTDSLNYNNAQISRLDAVQALLDAWGTVKKTKFEWGEYISLK